MKKSVVRISMLAALLLALGTAFAMHGPDDVKNHPSCKYCGMDRGKFAASRMLITYSDGTETGTCSLRCAALDLAVNIGRTPKTILVADYDTGKLIEAERARWVLGGRKTGVMTGRAKWAFSGEAAAAAFIKENDGTAISFEEAVQAAFEDMYMDTRMIREKRKKKGKMEMGH